MKSANNKILVRCNLEQKDFMEIGDVVIKTANSYNSNYRERSPVVAQVMQDTEELYEGNIILCHHNTFYEPSPFYLYDDLFSIPYKKEIIFAKIDSEGNARAVCGNIIAEQIWIATAFELPPELRKKYADRVMIVDDNYGYKKGQIVFTRPSTGYEMVYMHNQKERRVVKINAEMILGKLVESQK